MSHQKLIQSVRAAIVEKRQSFAVDQIRRLVASGVSLGNCGPDLLGLALALADEDSALEIAKAIHTENPHEHRHAFILAERYSRIGRSDIALQIIESLEQTTAPKAAINYFISVYSGHLGRLDQTAASARKAIAHKPDFGDAWAVLAATGQYSDTDQARLETLFETGPPHAFPGAAYALGSLYHDKGDPERAWAAWREANQIESQKQPYSVAADSAAMKDIVEAFSKLADPMPKASRGFQSAFPKPVFVVGTPRSGTSLTEQIIATAKGTYAMGETLFSRLATWPLGNLTRADIRLAGGFQTDAIDWGLIGRVYRSLSKNRSNGASVVTDKGAVLNLFVGALAHALPEAKFVWVNRDTRDIALSAWRTYLTGGARWRHSLADARTYLSAHEKMMVDWCEMFPDRIYRLNYEDLARSPQAEVNDLMRFLELPAPDLSMSDLLGATVSTASFAQIRSKITTRSVGGWKTYERWFNPVFD